jgi:hypothetical protein
MLEKSDFWGIYKSKPMPHDCFHEDGLEFYFFCNNNILNINMQDAEKSKIIFEAVDFELVTEENSDKFQLQGENLESNDLHKVLNGKMFIRIPRPAGFKLYLEEFGWRYFEKTDSSLVPSLPIINQ